VCSRGYPGRTLDESQERRTGRMKVERKDDYQLYVKCLATILASMNPEGDVPSKLADGAEALGDDVVGRGGMIGVGIGDRRAANI
jgi:hypothetical protein